MLNEAPAAIEVAARLGLPVEIVPLHMSPTEIVDRIPPCTASPSRTPVPFHRFWCRQSAAVGAAAAHGPPAPRRRRRAACRDSRRGLASLDDATALATVCKSLRDVDTPAHSAVVVGTLRGLAVKDPERYAVWTTDLFDEPSLARVFPAIAAGDGGLPALERLRGEPMRTTGLRHFMQMYNEIMLAPSGLSKLEREMDIATMAHGLEARSPFLDIPLAELAWSIPPHMLLQRRATKPLLRSLARARLPQSVSTAPKRGFEVPLASWLRGPLRDMVFSTVLASDSREIEVILDPVRAWSGHRRLSGELSGAVGIAHARVALRAPSPAPGV